MCNNSNEFILLLEENVINNSDLLPTFESEEIPFKDSTFKLTRKEIDKYYIAFQNLFLKIDKDIFFTIQERAIDFDLSLLLNNVCNDELNNHVSHPEACLLKNEINHCCVLLFCLKLKSDLMHSTLKFNY
jgi:hypothetical protein